MKNDVNRAKCLAPEHHRAECECALRGFATCEGCAKNTGKHVTIRLLNGGLILCVECLAEFNGKNPELNLLRAERDKLRGELFAAETNLQSILKRERVVLARTDAEWAELEAENERLRAALDPFALLGSENARLDPRILVRIWSDKWSGREGVPPTLADCFRAAELLAAKDITK